MAGIAFVNCTYNATLHRMFPIMHPRCPEQSWLAVLLMALYLVLVNVLLLNLLIAMLTLVRITHRKIIDFNSCIKSLNMYVYITAIQ